MKPRTKRTDAIDEVIVSRLEDGETLTQICKGNDMPTLRAVQKWRREDSDFEGLIHDAWVGAAGAVRPQLRRPAAFVGQPNELRPQTYSCNGRDYT